LQEVDAAAQTQDGRYLFAFGQYLVGPDRIGVVQRQNNQWSMFHDGAGLWANSDPGNTLTVGMIAGVEYLFVHGGDTIYQFRLSDNSLVQMHELEDGSYWDPHMQVAADRLFFGSNNSGLIVFEVDANGFHEIARRDGLDAGRFAVRMEGQAAHVYYTRFRGDPNIGYTRFDF